MTIAPEAPHLAPTIPQQRRPGEQLRGFDPYGHSDTAPSTPPEYHAVDAPYQPRHAAPEVLSLEDRLNSGRHAAPLDMAGLAIERLLAENTRAATATARMFARRRNWGDSTIDSDAQRTITALETPRAPSTYNNGNGFQRENPGTYIPRHAAHEPDNRLDAPTGVHPHHDELGINHR